MWHKKAVDAGITTRPDGVTWKQLVVENEQIVGKLKTALDAYAALGKHRIDGINIEELQTMITQKEPWEKVYEYVKKKTDWHVAHNSSGIAWTSFYTKLGDRKISGRAYFTALVSHETEILIVAKEFPYLASHGQFLTVAPDEGILFLAERKIPFLAGHDNQIISLPLDDPVVAQIKVQRAVRHAIQKLLTKGDQLKQHP